MNKIAADPAQPYRGLIAGYTDAIRQSDFKANIAILFVAFMMGPVLGNYPRFPHYLPIPFVMLPFLIVYICLLAVLIPRYPKRGGKHFIVSRNATIDDFAKVVEAEDELEQLKLRCSVLSELLVVEDPLHSHQFFCRDGEHRREHVFARLHLVCLGERAR